MASTIKIDTTHLQCGICYTTQASVCYGCTKCTFWICDDCFSQLNPRRCGACRNPHFFRNRQLETVIANSEVSCPYQSLGCSFTGAKNALEKHIGLCEYYVCPCPGCTQRSTKLLYTESALAEHMIKEHKNPYILKGCNGDKLEMTSDRLFSGGIFMASCNKHLSFIYFTPVGSSNVTEIRFLSVSKPTNAVTMCLSNIETVSPYLASTSLLKRRLRDDVFRWISTFYVDNNNILDRFIFQAYYREMVSCRRDRCMC